MKLFDDIIGEIRDYIDKRESAGAARRFRVTGDVAWPAAGDRDIVLQADTGVELGNPRDESPRMAGKYPNCLETAPWAGHCAVEHPAVCMVDNTRDLHR